MRLSYLVGELSAHEGWFIALGGIKYVHGAVESGRADHSRIGLAHRDTGD